MGLGRQWRVAAARTTVVSQQAVEANRMARGSRTIRETFSVQAVSMLERCCCRLSHSVRFALGPSTCSGRKVRRLMALIPNSFPKACIRVFIGSDFSNPERLTFVDGSAGFEDVVVADHCLASFPGLRYPCPGLLSHRPSGANRHPAHVATQPPIPYSLLPQVRFPCSRRSHSLPAPIVVLA